MSQYKCPCSFLPLDGYRHNNYPLSHNPPKLNNLYGGKKTINRRKTNGKKTINRKSKNRKKTNGRKKSKTLVKRNKNIRTKKK